MIIIYDNIVVDVMVVVMLIMLMLIMMMLMLVLIMAMMATAIYVTFCRKYISVLSNTSTTFAGLQCIKHGHRNEVIGIIKKSKQA